MAEQQRLNLIIGANVDRFNKALTKVQKDLGRFARSVESAGSVLTSSITIPLGLAGAAAIKTFADFDRLEKGLQALSGVAGEGKRQMKDLLDVVKDAKTTLSLEDAAKGSLQLQAIGFSADRAAETLRQLGIAATVSGSSSDDVAEVARQFSQAAAKGKILQQELRIVLERIPALAGVIAKEFGTVTAEGLREAGVSADEFIGRLTKAIQQNERFQSVQGSLAKSFETFAIEVQIAAAELGGAIAKSIDLQGKLEKLSAFVSRVAAAFANLSGGTQKAIVYFGIFAVALGPALIGLGTFARLLSVGLDGIKLFTSFGKFLVGTLATIASAANAAAIAFRALSIAQKATIVGVALTAITAVVLLYQKYASAAREASEVQKLVSVASEDAAGQIDKQKKAVAELVSEYAKEGATLEEQRSVINRLKQINSEYFGGLEAGKSSLEDIDKASREYTKTLLEQSKAQAVANLGLLDEQLLKTRNSFKDSVDSAKPYLKILSFLPNGGILASEALRGVASGVDSQVKSIEAARESLKSYLGQLEELQNTKPTTPTDPTGGGAGIVQSTINLAPIGSADFLKSFAQLNIRIFEEGRKTQEALSNALGLEGVVRPTRAALASVGIAAREAFGQYESAIRQAGREFEIFGNKQQFLQDQLEATKTALTALAAAGDITSEQFVELKTNYDNLTLASEALAAKTEQITAFQAGLRDAFINTFQALGEQLAAGEASVLKFAATFISAILDAVNAALKMIAVSAFEKAITSGGPFGAFLAPVLAIGAISAIKAILGKASIPKLAGGGLATAPTLAVVGDNPNARVDPEVISPLSKLKKLIGGGGDGAYIAEARISGQDLLVLMKRAELAYNRVR